MYVELMQRLHARMVSLRNEEGATALEYGLFAALIAAVIVGVVTILGTDVKKAFQTVIDALPS